MNPSAVPAVLLSRFGSIVWSPISTTGGTGVFVGVGVAVGSGVGVLVGVGVGVGVLVGVGVFVGPGVPVVVGLGVGVDVGVGVAVGGAADDSATESTSGEVCPLPLKVAWYCR